MKKFLPFIFIALVVVGLALAGYFFFIKGGQPSATAPRPTPLEPVNTIDVKDRPYVTLAPTVGGKHPQGREVTLTLTATALNSKSVEYELEYQAGSLLQGVFGRIDLAEETLPVSKDLLLGSCSAGGKCSYHEDVTGGTLTLRFRGGDQDFALKGEWNFQNMADREGKFSSRDGKFQLDTGKTGLPSAAIVLIAQTMGLPAAVEGDILSGPYGVFTNNHKLKGPAQLTMRLSEDVTTAKLLGFTGKTWKEYKSQVSDKTLTATVDTLTTFLAVSQ